MRVYKVSTFSVDILVEDDDRDVIRIPQEKLEELIETLRKVANGEKVEENI